MAALGEEAGVELAFGGQADAGTGGAEGLGHRGDDADLAAAVGVAPALGNLAVVVRVGGLERKLRADAGDDVGGRQHLVHAPAVGTADIHVFDEAQDVARMAEVARQRQDLVIVGAALDHAIHLDRRQARGGRGGDAVEHVAHGVIDVVHALESGVVDAVEADRDPVEAGILECPRLLRQQRAVGGQGDFHGELRQLFDQVFEVAAQERLAAGDADLFHAEVDEDMGDAHDFFEGQQLLAREIGVVVAKDFLRHAIHAAEIAAVGDRDAQVAHAPVATIGEIAFRRGGEVVAGRQRGARLAQDGNDGNDAVGHGTPNYKLRRASVQLRAGPRRP